MRHLLLSCLFAVAVSACATVLDIEEASCDPDAPACAAELGEVAEPATPCEAFCDQAQKACRGNSAAYTSSLVCLGVCELYGKAQLECRVRELELASDLSEPSTHCPAASIAGTRDDASETCDTACGSYCRNLEKACPESFDSRADNPLELPVYDDRSDCVSSCRREIVEAPRGLSVRDRTGDTLQCRLWHLAQATVDPVHCSHARGDCPCAEEATCNAVLEQ